LIKYFKLRSNVRPIEGSVYFRDSAASAFRDSVLRDSEVNVAKGMTIVPIMCGSSIDMLALYVNGGKWYKCLIIDGITHLTDLLCTLLKALDIPVNLHICTSKSLSVSCNNKTGCLLLDIVACDYCDGRYVMLDRMKERTCLLLLLQTT
jgi:hypothetical protein